MSVTNDQGTINELGQDISVDFYTGGREAEPEETTQKYRDRRDM